MIKNPKFFHPLHIKKFEPEGGFWGYASTQTIDQINDQIQAGAFGQTLEDWRNQKGRYPYLHWEHQNDEIIGCCHELYEDSYGLYVRGRLFIKDFPRALSAYQCLQRGISGLSIGFVIMQCQIYNGIRKIYDLSLEEISFTQNPCNPDAKIYEHKNLSAKSVLAGLETLNQTLRRR